MNKETDEGVLLVLDAKIASILVFDTNGNMLGTLIKRTAGVPDGIAIDPVSKHIYWTNMGEHPQGEHFYDNDGSIERADHDGSNQVTIIPKGGTFTPKQMTIDSTNGFIYWSDREGMRVMRARLDGSDITTLIRTGEGDPDREDETRHCVGVAVDPKNDFIYWTQKGPANGNKGRIFRAGLSASKGFDPAQRRDVELLWDNLPEPIDLEIDHLNGQLYWTDRGDGTGGNTLNRASITKQALGNREILCTGLKEGIGLALDKVNGNVFVTDLTGHLYCYHQEEPSLHQIYSGDHFFTGIAFLPKLIFSNI